MIDQTAELFDSRSRQRHCLDHCGGCKPLSSPRPARHSSSGLATVGLHHDATRLPHRDREQGGSIRIMAGDCVFCDLTWMRTAEISIETELCIFASTRDPGIRADAGLPPDVLPGAGAIVPIAHRTSPFDLTVEEWADTRELLLKARAALHELLAPDGYTLGWNDQAGLHAHLHVIPRFDDEPLADRGIRSAIKGAENRRPDPWEPGTDRALRSL